MPDTLGDVSAPGGTLPARPKTSFNFGSMDAPEDGGPGIRKGGPPPLHVWGGKGRIQRLPIREALPPRLLFSPTASRARHGEGSGIADSTRASLDAGGPV